MTIRAITYRMVGGKTNKLNTAEKRESGGEEKKLKNPMRGHKGLTRLTLMEAKHKHLKVTEADHRTIKTLAAAAGKSIIAFIPDLLKAYKGKSK